MNADKQKGVKLTLNADKGIGYQFEAMTNLDIEVKKIRSRHAFKPRVYVRTPTDELVEFNADIEYILDKSLKIQSRLEKITKIPFIFSSKILQL
ncbi:hypothetical protein DPMN_105040 [Dreissena polymorpha]|uniref:Uncharacterized protein n=1 Tax=Dreissena polymorpha TaxID=45954 RepID=A0A9D4K0K3_DREPO|nr:hypothetical protein DPMN_105040 [Dreissena polymorpha]